jgi:hypothetical protein
MKCRQHVLYKKTKKILPPTIQVMVSGLHPHYIKLFHFTCGRMLLYLSVNSPQYVHQFKNVNFFNTLNTFHTTALYLSIYFSIMCHHHYPLYIPDEKKNQKTWYLINFSITDALKVKKTVKHIQCKWVIRTFEKEYSLKFFHYFHL